MGLTEWLAFLVAGVGSGIVLQAISLWVQRIAPVTDIMGSFEAIKKVAPTGFSRWLYYLAYGLLLAAAYILIYSNLPGTTRLWRGLSFAAFIWVIQALWMVLTHRRGPSGEILPLFDRPQIAALGAWLFGLMLVGLLFAALIHPS
jgi:hypothetical protein